MPDILKKATVLVLNRHWQAIHVGIIGLMPLSEGNAANFQRKPASSG